MQLTKIIIFTGIFKTTGQPEPRVTIDVSNVVEMRSDKVEGGVLTVGAAVSINRLAGLLVGASGGEIFATAHRHLKKVAGNTIRNVRFEIKTLVSLEL